MNVRTIDQAIDEMKTASEVGSPDHEARKLRIMAALARELTMATHDLRKAVEGDTASTIELQSKTVWLTRVFAFAAVAQVLVAVVAVVVASK